MQVVQPFNAQLPCTPSQLASFCASEQLFAIPGDRSSVRYNNTGYFMLSQIVARLRNVSSFEAAITPTLLQPLGITRVRESRTLVATQASDEARYHSSPLQTANSVMSPDQPMVPLGYGETNLENGDGTGGLSAAVTDVARILAALSLREGNPILDDGTLLMLLNNSAANGGHGFDWVQAVNGIYRGVKGGLLSTSANSIYFTTGGLSYVICWNGLSPKGEEWYPIFSYMLCAAEKAVERHVWDGIDLFPQYGMASLRPEIVISPTLQIELDLRPLPETRFDAFSSPFQRPLHMTK
jgi:CubicO group peptidase (beta-lactamase class C family)